jgi:Zn-dependent protease
VQPDVENLQILSYALAVIPTVLSVTIHEYAHARVAIALGDTTPRETDRDTLNPFEHFDLLGTILLPAISTHALGAPLLGWGKPTPCWPAKFRSGVSPRWGHLAVALAGPLANLLLAVLAALAFNVGAQRGLWAGSGGLLKPLSGGMFLLTLARQNAAFALLHLLPLPPFDGYRLVPRRVQSFMQPYERWGVGVALGVFMFVPFLAAPLGVPLNWMGAMLFSLVDRVVPPM